MYIALSFGRALAPLSLLLDLSACHIKGVFRHISTATSLYVKHACRFLERRVGVAINAKTPTVACGCVSGCNAG